MGWVGALGYVALLHAHGGASVWLGALLGLLHAALLLTAGVRVLPAVHPGMASEHHGPPVKRQLEPPGFLGLNYGRWTPAVVTVAHALYSAAVGLLYHTG